MAQKPGSFLRDQLTVETKETLQAQKPTQTEPDVVEEFQALDNKYFQYSNIQARQNKPHNRYNDILPWDNFIPKIEGLECNYCNASIWLHGGRNIIMTQAPLQNTLEQFWAVVYQYKVAVVVKLVENNPKRCYFYWPEVGQSYEAGRYKVSCLEYKQTTPPPQSPKKENRENEGDDDEELPEAFSYRILEIVDLKAAPPPSTAPSTSETQTKIPQTTPQSSTPIQQDQQSTTNNGQAVPQQPGTTSSTQIASSQLVFSQPSNPVIPEETIPIQNTHMCVMLEYLNWPDYGVPDNCRILVTLVEAAHKISENLRKPILVHCSAGIGRSGTFCAVEIVLSNVLDCLIHYRNARGSANILTDELLLKQLETQFSQLLSLPQVVLSLRASRHPKVVQTAVQFMFCYTAIGQIASAFGLYNSLPKWFPKNSILDQVQGKEKNAIDGVKDAIQNPGQILDELYIKLGFIKKKTPSQTPREEPLPQQIDIQNSKQDPPVTKPEAIIPKVDSTTPKIDSTPQKVDTQPSKMESVPTKSTGQVQKVPGIQIPSVGNTPPIQGSIQKGIPTPLSGSFKAGSSFDIQNKLLIQGKSSPAPPQQGQQQPTKSKTEVIKVESIQAQPKKDNHAYVAYQQGNAKKP